MGRVCLWCIAICVGGLAGKAIGVPPATNSASVVAEKVDFLRDIHPIFEQHCIGCHGEESQGSLRLDSRAYAAEGGHSGSPVLGGDITTNAILQRVTNTDESIRMPKDSPPLTGDEQDRLRRWVEQGTPWTDPPRTARSQRVGGYELTWDNLRPWNPRDWTNSRFRRVEWWFWRFGCVLIPLLLWIGACDRARLWVQANHPQVQPPRGRLWRHLAATSRGTQLAALLIWGLAAAFVFHQQETRQADSEIAALQTEVAQLERQNNPTATPPGQTPRILRRQHPPRLGGEYYRGNDERNPKLFNGGFYRTCTMRVWLCRADGSIVAWDEAVDPGQCKVRFEIEQSPGATSALFAPAIMENSYVSTLAPGDEVIHPESEVAAFRSDGDRRWVATIPLDLSRAAVGRQTGRIYLCRGAIPMAGASVVDAHYAAEYMVRLQDNRVTPDSELWLGCIFRTGNVVVVPEGRIADDEWFSFRPIPEIVGQQTTDDPKLLGIDDHQPPPPAQESAGGPN